MRRSLLQRYTAEPLFTRELEILAAEKGLQVVQLPGPRRTPSSVLGPAASGLPELTASAALDSRPCRARRLPLRA